MVPFEERSRPPGTDLPSGVSTRTETGLGARKDRRHLQHTTLVGRHRATRPEGPGHRSPDQAGHRPARLLVDCGSLGAAGCPGSLAVRPATPGYCMPSSPSRLRPLPVGGVNPSVPGGHRRHGLQGADLRSRLAGERRHDGIARRRHGNAGIDRPGRARRGVRQTAALAGRERAAPGTGSAPAPARKSVTTGRAGPDPRPVRAGRPPPGGGGRDRPGGGPLPGRGPGAGEDHGQQGQPEGRSDGDRQHPPLPSSLHRDLRRSPARHAEVDDQSVRGLP
jgi:hypothetical protein